MNAKLEKKNTPAKGNNNKNRQGKTEVLPAKMSILKVEHITLDTAC